MVDREPARSLCWHSNPVPGAHSSTEDSLRAQRARYRWGNQFFLYARRHQKQTNQNDWRTAERDGPLDSLCAPRSKSTEFGQRRSPPEPGGEEAAAPAEASWKPTKHHGTRLRERMNGRQAQSTGFRPSWPQTRLSPPANPPRERPDETGSISQHRPDRERGPGQGTLRKRCDSLRTRQGQHGKGTWRIKRERPPEVTGPRR